MERALISDIHKVAPHRGTGYLEACMKAGKLSDDKLWLEFDDAAHAELRQRFNPGAVAAQRSGAVAVGAVPQRGGLRLGDKLHSILGPIGRAVNWPCLKGDGTTDLKPGSPCDNAKNALNKI